MKKIISAITLIAVGLLTSARASSVDGVTHASNYTLEQNIIATNNSGGLVSVSGVADIILISSNSPNALETLVSSSNSVPVYIAPYPYTIGVNGVTNYLSATNALWVVQSATYVNIFNPTNSGFAVGLATNSLVIPPLFRNTHFNGNLYGSIAGSTITSTGGVNVIRVLP